LGSPCTRCSLLSASTIQFPWLIPIRSPKFLLLIIGFFTLSMLVLTGITSAVDENISIRFKAVQENETWNLVITILSSVGDISTLLILAIVLTVMKRTRRLGMIFLTVIPIIVISGMYIKVVIGRQNPPYGFVSPLEISENKIIEDDSPSPLAKNLSYPSIYIAVAAAMAYIVGFKLNRKSKTFGLAIWSFPVIMAITRLYVMQSYLIDVIAGFLFGLIISVTMSNLMRLDLSV
jgi:undecaprenyl-diphosphatase